MKKQTIIAIALSVLISPLASADKNLIHAGELLAVPGEKVLKQQSILIQGDKIVWIKPGYITTEKDTKIIDLKSSFVMPGLMDMHVHLQGEIGPNNDSDQLKMSDELATMRSIHYAKKTLMAGFTTVRDAGSNPQPMYALRDAIESGWVDGPRIIAAGGVGITGGHGDTSGIKPDLMEHYASQQVCDGPYDCRRAARRAIKFGGDWIKVAATGGVLTDRATGTGQQMQMDELKEIVQAAKTMGKKVAAHAHQEDGIVAALEAGVASIEHGTYAGKKAIRLFKKTGAYLVPTLLAGDTVKTMAENSDFFSPAIKEKAIRVGNDMKGNFAKAYKAGVKIAFGTDSGVSKHGTNAQEAVLMVEAGMPAMKVLESATVNAADLIDKSAIIGTLASGKQADIIATDGSPLKDIKELLDVDFVMKSGKVYKQ
jgi:imidazolonepropionase-like amidohydrolase